ncbi:DMT family transporter [Rhodobacteraceae bacterium CCMM004]|nr:DMT family transporter [Rhodobacteraceae bacterium CCMM004]
MAQAAAAREDRPALGLILMTLAVAFFTGIDTSAKWLILAGLPPLQVVFARYAGHFLVSLALFVPREGMASFRSARPGVQALRSICLLGATICNFFALEFLPITTTITIFFAAPMVVTLLAIPVLGERVGLRRFLAVAVGFLGVVIVMQPGGQAWHPAMLLSLAALSFASTYFVLTRMLAGVETNATSQLWSAGLATAVLAPVALPIWAWPDTPVGWAVLIGIGVLGAAGHILTVTANRFAEASSLAPVVYTQILVAAAVGWWIFDTPPTQWTLLGGAVIIASGLYIWRRERRLGRPPDAPGP